MTYLCRDCGNTESFRGTQNYTKRGWEEVFMDGEGDINDYGDSEDTDTENEGIEDVECQECNSSNTEWVELNEEELEEEVQAIKTGKKKEQKANTKVTNWKKEFEKNDTEE